MTTDFDALLAQWLNEPAEAAALVAPQRRGSSARWLLRQLSGNKLEASLKSANVLAVTRHRVLVLPWVASYGSSTVLGQPLLDWPRADVIASAEQQERVRENDDPFAVYDWETDALVALDMSCGTQRLRCELRGEHVTAVLAALGVAVPTAP